jgi:hypothetical protein
MGKGSYTGLYLILERNSYKVPVVVVMVVVAKCDLTCVQMFLSYN